VFFKDGVPICKLLTDFSRIRYRAVIEILTLENVSPQQIHNQTTVVGLYGKDTPSYATVSVSKFKETSPWSEIFEPEGAQVHDRKVVDMTVRTDLFTGIEKLRDPYRLYIDIGGDYIYILRNESMLIGLSLI